MRWVRLSILGLTSVYPLYWTAQFVLFFVPESLVGFWLGQPVQETLYFAGEATEATGHCGTVHGAIASGVNVGRALSA